VPVGDGKAPVPFEVHGRRGQEHLAREMTGLADLAFFQGLGHGQARHLEAEVSGLGWIERQEIDRPADGRAHAFDGKAGQPVDAGFAGRKPAPVLRLAGAERGDHADAGDGDGLSLFLSHPILSITAMPSPR